MDGKNTQSTESLVEINTAGLAKLMRLTVAEVGTLVAKRIIPAPAREDESDLYWSLAAIKHFLQSELAAHNERRSERGRKAFDLEEVSWRRVFASQVTSSKVVLEAVEEIARDAGYATRRDLFAVTGLERCVVDDRLKVLVQRGLLQRIRPGTYTLAAHEEKESRSISLTHLPDGTSKLEFGDVCETLSASERRRLAQLLVGDAMQLSNLQAGRDANLLAQELFLVTNMLRMADSERVAALAKAGVKINPMPWKGVSPHLERFSRNLSDLGTIYE